MAESAEHRSESRDRGTTISQAYLSTGKSLRRFIARICPNPADAEDIAQEALVRAMSAESDRPIENPKAYLYRVAHNLAVRKRSRRTRDIMSYLDDIEEGELASAAPSIEDDVIVRERLGHLCDAIDTLPPACRQVFVMRKVYGHSHKEIAKKLGISTSTVEKHLATGFTRCVASMRTHEARGAESAGELRVASARARIRQV